MMSLIPVSLQGYKRAWLSTDVIAGATLAAVAIPEVMGYTSIAQTPLVTGLYTIIFPTMVFVLLGSSRLLVVGGVSADSLKEWRGGPVQGFGIGSSLYKPGDDAATVRLKATAIVSAFGRKP